MPAPPAVPETSSLAARLKASPPREAAALLAAESHATAVEALLELNPGVAQDLLAELPRESFDALASAAAPEVARQWQRNARYPDGTVGRLMEPAYAVFSPRATVGEAIEQLRGLVRTAFVTYGYVEDTEGRLLRLFTMRDLLFSDRDVRLDAVMLRDVFAFRPDMTVSDGMKLTLNRHFPVYPVCDPEGRLLGLVRGAALFEEEAFEITAQPGAMVGVEREDVGLRRVEEDRDRSVAGDLQDPALAAGSDRPAVRERRDREGERLRHLGDRLDVGRERQDSAGVDPDAGERAGDETGLRLDLVDPDRARARRRGPGQGPRQHRAGALEPAAPARPVEPAARPTPRKDR